MIRKDVLLGIYEDGRKGLNGFIAQLPAICVILIIAGVLGYTFMFHFELFVVVIVIANCTSGAANIYQRKLKEIDQTGRKK